MKKVLETAMILMGTLGFWGFVYPEFCLTEETYKVESADEKEAGEDSFKENQIVVKSKLLEYLFFLKETYEDTGEDMETDFS